MIVVNTHEAKTKLSQLLATIEDHKEIIRICRNGKPIADLSPISKTINPLQKHKPLADIKILKKRKS